MQGSNKEDINATDILDLLDQEGIAPKRFLSHLEEKVEKKEEKSNIDIVEFPKLSSKNV
jgi:predicted nucleic acid-binding protein